MTGLSRRVDHPKWQLIHLSSDNHSGQLFSVPFDKRYAPRQHNVQEDAEGPHISLGVVGGDLEEHLRSHVDASASDAAHACLAVEVAS